MASEEMIQAINKHLMGDAEEFIELRERFEGHGYMPPSAAAALGYLIAKDELEAAKEEEEEPDVYDEVVGVLRKCWHPPGPISAHTTADEIFTLIYEWLESNMEMRGFVNSHVTVKDKIRQMFQPYIINKPKA